LASRREPRIFRPWASHGASASRRLAAFCGTDRFVRRAVQAELDGFLSLSAVDVINEDHLHTLSHGDMLPSATVEE
jgi:hypothetical protein